MPAPCSPASGTRTGSWRTRPARTCRRCGRSATTSRRASRIWRPRSYQVHERPADVLRRPVPGPLFRVVKVASWVELGLFAILLIVWLVPGMEHATFYAGLVHGIGFVALALLIWVAVLRHEAPYTLLAATLTPVGPAGSVIAIADRKSTRLN